MTFGEVAYRLRYWLAEQNIDSKSFTFIINIDDELAAVNFDSALRSQFGITTPELQYAPLDLREGFELYGLKFRIESPLHADPGKVIIRRFVFPKA